MDATSGDILFNVALYTISQTKPYLITLGIITLFIYLYTIPRAGELTTDRVCKIFFSRVLPTVLLVEETRVQHHNP
jgi:hypothetical protein